MKNIYTLLILVNLIFFFSSCEKDTETYDKDLLLGNWEKIDIQLGTVCNDYLEFHVDTYRYKKICGSSSTTSSFIQYTLDGKNIVVDDQVEFKILYLTQDYLKFTDTEGRFSEFKKP